MADVDDGRREACHAIAFELRAVAEADEESAGAVDVPVDKSTTPPNPRIRSSEVAGDEAGTDAAERIGGCPPLLGRRFLPQVAVDDQTFLCVAAQLQ